MCVVLPGVGLSMCNTEGELLWAKSHASTLVSSDGGGVLGRRSPCLERYYGAIIRVTRYVSGVKTLFIMDKQ